MRQGKCAVSVEMKQVIGTLCRLLRAAGLEAVPAPETFRRAKFAGGADVECQLLQLLMEVLQTSGTISSEDHMEGELRNQVVAGLWQTGYYVDWMYKGAGEKEQGGESSTSRDLLLALGWLIAAGTLEKLLRKRVQQLDKTLLTPTDGTLQLSSEVCLDPASLRKLQWLTGCLRYQGWSLLSMQEERARLLHAVLFALMPSSTSSKQNSPLLKEDCACIQQLCDLLETYLSWKEAETSFWTWMDSVVDSHLTDPRVKKVACAPDGISKCYHGKQGLETLEEMLLTLPRAQTPQRSKEKTEDRDQGVKLSVREDDTTFLPRFLFPLASGPSVLQVYQPRLKPVKSSKRTRENLPRGFIVPDELPASDAKQLLQQTKSLLWSRKQSHRLANRIQIQDLSDRLDGLVMIPP